MVSAVMSITIFLNFLSFVLEDENCLGVKPSAFISSNTHSLKRGSIGKSSFMTTTFLDFSATVAFALDCELLEQLLDFSLDMDLTFLFERSNDRDLERYLCLSLPFELLFLELL